MLLAHFSKAPGVQGQRVAERHPRPRPPARELSLARLTGAKVSQKHPPPRILDALAHVCGGVGRWAESAGG
ncbi:hypothetical protein PSCLAVI8L_60029 [Pseudoclavibacter sp. 8L]|nr:hypothetical protein PSCLAVI8L_60029 [Pseudoclavibacter sp. 8L]